MNRRFVFGFFAVFLAGALFGASCLQFYFYSTFLSDSLSGLSVDELYARSFLDVMVVAQNMTYSGLTPVVEENADLVWKGDPGNRSVLVVVFTRFGSSYPVGQIVNTTWGETYVTLAPDIKEFFANNVAGDANLTLRAAQLLGLPPTTANTYFVELWVSPTCLFRPSADNEITDTTAQIAFPDSVTDEFRQWYNDYIIYAYYPPRFPWTRLGYTYDWGNSGSHVGLSEFVISANALVEVESVSLVDDYLNP